MGRETEKQSASIGFIGGGRITRIFLDGWKKEGKLPVLIRVSDNNPDILTSLQTKYPEIEVSLENVKAAECDVVFLALHPPAIGSILEGVKSALKHDALLISLAPKWTIDKISAALGGFNRIVRMIPNAPSAIGEGYNPVVFSNTIADDEKKDMLRLFKAFGDCPEVEEGKLEAYAILSAMGPTYLWFQIQKLRELGTFFGLKEQETDKALYKMVKGANKTLFKSGLAYIDVVDLIPVKPLGEEEPGIRQIYQTRLNSLYLKLTS